MNKQVLKDKLTTIEEKPIQSIILRFCASWVTTAFLGIILWKASPISITETAKSNILLVGGLLVLFYVLLYLGDRFVKKFPVSRTVLPIFLAAYTVIHSFLANDYYYVFGITAVWALLFFYYSSQGWLYLKKPFTVKKTVILSVLAFLLFMFFAGTTGMYRYLTYSSPNFDFGIFAHMFRNMKESLAPVTTCERDGLLSHFHVHVSPALYLLLPVYYLFSSPVTLQISQALILISAAIPMFLLAKHFSFSNIRAWLLSAILVLYPATAQGMNYDFHENCLLLPFLMWMFYFFEKGKYLPMFIFAALTLTVKEDAAVYIIFFALYVIVSRRKYVAGTGLFLGAALYFAASLLYLSKYGDGVMVTRYSNFIAEDGGLVEAVKNVLANPSYVFSQLFTDRDGEATSKLLYVLQMLVPVAFLPFTGKKFSRYILLLPFVLINLMTTYPYQFDIGFQYSFGTGAFLLYLSVLNLKDSKSETAKWLQCTAFVSCFLCFMSFVLPNATHYASKYRNEAGIIEALDSYLEEIPEDKSVIASAFLVPHLVNRDEIYEVEYHATEGVEKCDYVLFDMRGDYDELIAKYKAMGYHETDRLTYEGKLLVVKLEP